MSVVMCDRCDKMVDLDWHVEDIIYIDLKAVCTDCATEKEVDVFEAECEAECKRKTAIWNKQKEEDNGEDEGY